MISLTSPVETKAHTWPAGVKLAALCLATVVLFQVDALPLHIVCFAGTVTLYALLGWTFLRGGIKRLALLWPFVAMILLWHGIAGDLAQGILSVLRMATVVALANLVTMTTRLSDMMQVMACILSPLRRLGVPSRAVELSMALVIRFTPDLVQKGAILTQSWRARSARRPNWRIVVPFCVTAIDDAEHVAEAVRARGGV